MNSHRPANAPCISSNAIIYYLNSETAAASADISAISQLLTSVVIIPVDSRLARFAGYLRREYRLKTADSAIAGTALLTHTTLVTRNVEDFQRISTLSLMRI